MRKSGILMPLFSLPSKWAIGTMGAPSYAFIDFLKSAGQSVWQMLPIVPADYTYSPYQSFSCFAGDPVFIDPELMVQDGLLNPDVLTHLKSPESPYFVDYDTVKYNNELFLKSAFENYSFGEEYNKFLENNRFWVFDYAMYLGIKKATEKNCWTEFEEPLKVREKSALDTFYKANKSLVDYYIFIQFVFFKQWQKLKDYAKENGIEIFGDMPIYAPLDSADVWANKNCFMLDKNGSPSFIAGTPPDAFSKFGQLWGCPVYDFESMKKQDVPYLWWRRRIAHANQMFTSVRIDHFRAFESFYAIPAGEKTAENGRWIKGPGKEFFDLCFEDIGKVSVVAEDLGLITKPVRELLESTGFPGMRVLQFAFDGDKTNPYLPHNYSKNTVAYIGTHDNTTVNAWYDTLDAATKKRVDDYIAPKGEGINWALIRALMRSSADTVIFTMQDIMSLPENARINTPGTTSANWRWRMANGCANDWLAGIIKEMTEIYGR